MERRVLHRTATHFKTQTPRTATVRETESALEDSDIDIGVVSGVVTLNGTVKTSAGKTRAVAIAKATDRVKSVKDNLKVG